MLFLLGYSTVGTCNSLLQDSMTRIEIIACDTLPTPSACIEEDYITGNIYGIYHAASILVADGTVPDGQTAEFRAGQTAVLEQGFTVELQAGLSVKIEDCPLVFSPLRKIAKYKDTLGSGRAKSTIGNIPLFSYLIISLNIEFIHFLQQPQLTPIHTLLFQFLLKVVQRHFSLPMPNAV